MPANALAAFGCGGKSAPRLVLLVAIALLAARVFANMAAIAGATYGASQAVAASQKHATPVSSAATTAWYNRHGLCLTLAALLAFAN
jgi:hypothetical protein